VWFYAGGSGQSADRGDSWAGLALPLLLLAWLARRCVTCATACAAVWAAILSIVCCAGLFALAITAGWVVFGISAHGGGSVLLRACCSGAWTVKQEPATDLGVSWLAALQENWSYGRWLVGSTVLSPYASDANVLVPHVSLGAAGILRAMQLPSLVMMQVVMSTGLYFFPLFPASLAAE